MRRLLSLLSLTLCLFAATVHAAPGTSESVASSDQNGEEALSSRLVASHTQATPGQQIQLSWEFKLKPHWHIYFSNPGDSGLPPSLKQEAETLALTWPTPKPISIPPITNYGYEDAVTFTAPFTLPKTLAKGTQTITFKANYLYCNEICMPGRTELKLPITIAAKAVKNKDFKPAANLPEALGKAPGLNAEIAGRIIQLALPLNLTQPGARFIPADDGVIDDAAPQSLTGNILSIPMDTQATTTPDNLAGILVIGGKGYTFTTPLHAPVTEAQPEPKTSETPQPNPLSTTPTTSLLGAIFFAFLAGLILNLMPCVLPVLSLKLLGLVKHHHGQSRINHTAAYSLGVIASFWAFAICIAIFKTGTSSLGWGFQLQNPLFVATLTLLLLTIALNFFGVFELGHMLTRFGASPKTENRATLASSFGTGILAVIVATPCTVPFMGGAMAYALTQSLAEGLLIFTALGIGLAFPFLIAIPFPAVFRWVPKPGKWMATFRHALGWPMLATALWLGFVYGTQTGLFSAFLLLTVGLALSFGLWLFGTRPTPLTLATAIVIATAGLFALPHHATAPATISESAQWQPWSIKAVEEARANNQPVFVHFTASWCLTCKVTEATVLNTQTVQTLFKNTNTKLLVGDWTTEDPAITQELARHNRQGVPLYLLYTPGKPDPEILPQILTTSLLKEKLTVK